MLEKISFLSNRNEDDGTEEEMDDLEEGDGYVAEYNPGGGDLRSASDVHRSLVAPDCIERKPGKLRTGDKWVKGLWIGGYPDVPVDGLLTNLYSSAETRGTDISIHIDPRDTSDTLDRLEDKIEDLEADVEYLREKHRASVRGVESDLNDYEEMYDVLRNTQMEAFNVSTYMTVRGDNEDEIGSSAREVMTEARRAPANLTPILPRWSQLDAFVSGSPIARNVLDEDFDVETPMLGGGLGAMFPFVGGTFAEPGIEYGSFMHNGSPLIFDRFNRETGYCAMVIGRLGAGKSFATKLRLVRRVMYDKESVVIMLDPMREFAGVNEALGGENVTVGGTRGINPLEIKETPHHILEEVDDLDPWGEQITWVMTFFQTFFSQVANNPLGERSQTLRRAVQETYSRRGITRDPRTHSRESPTIPDVIEVLEDFADSPGEFGYATEGEKDAVQGDAESLLKDLRPSFRDGGELDNLSKGTEFDLDSKVMYLDLHQEEGSSGRAETSLMMQVLFNSVYERVKQTDKKVVFVLDEAHYLLNDASSLDFLETAVRHSRHFDLSLEFVTQTGGEFSLSSEAKTIANLCSIKVLHRVEEETEKLAEWFGLNERQVDFVQGAKAGDDEDGYSEGLIGVDQEGWFPTQIIASDHEAEVIDEAEKTVERRLQGQDEPELMKND